MHQVFIGLGSNISPRLTYLKKGLRGIDESGININKISSIYRTSPVGNENQSYFLNAVVSGQTALFPEELMKKLLAIEEACGRKRDILWGPRTLDLDFLLYDRLVLQSPMLTLPHPRLTERKFVLIPLLEIAPRLRGPDGTSFRKRLSALGAEQEVRLYRRDCFQA